MIGPGWIVVFGLIYFIILAFVAEWLLGLPKSVGPFPLVVIKSHCRHCATKLTPGLRRCDGCGARRRK